MWGRMSSNIPHRFSPDHLAEKKEINNNKITESQEKLNEGQNLTDEGQNLADESQKCLQNKRKLLSKRQSLPNIFKSLRNEEILPDKFKNFRCNSSSPQYKMWGQLPINTEHRFSPDHLTVKIDVSNKIELTNDCQNLNKGKESRDDIVNSISIEETVISNDILVNDSLISSNEIMPNDKQDCHLNGKNSIENVNSTDSSIKSQNDIVNTLIKNHYHESINGPIMEKHQYRCCISSDRLNQLRKVVENAIVERKTFTIKGGYNAVRNALLERGWIEKVETRPQPKTGDPINNQLTMDDVCTNLPEKQDWESAAAHIAKCEKTIISRLLQHHEVDFYWNLHKDGNEWQHRLNKNQILNRFSRSLFTSKEGLCLLLQQMYWHNEPGVSYVRFPRCYTINFADQCSAFLEDYRITACISLIKWFIQKLNKEGEFKIFNSEGKVPITAIKFAIDRCNDYVNVQKHLDIDKEFNKVWDHEWEQFITNFHLIIHKNELFAENSVYNLFNLENLAKQALKNIMPHWPQFELDGVQNVWIMKPGNKCRGRDIKLIKDANDVVRVMNNKLKYVVQKYIERPLLIYNTKFDIRQWFMVTCVQPLTVWMYRDCYLRFSSRKFCLEDFHEAIHLTNNAIQYKYQIATERDKALPHDNMWDNHTFKAWLRQIGQAEKWYKVIYPGMRESIVGAMLASQDTMDRRPNTFELYGADFMIAENFTPWLIEINSCPAMGPTTSVTSRMCPQCFEDILKVVIDRRKDPKADTGLFEMVYRQNLPQSPAYLGMMLSIRGKKLVKKRAQEDIQRRFTKKSYSASSDRRRTVSFPSSPKRTIDIKNYNGPIIENLIEEIHETLFKSVDIQNPSMEIIAENKPIIEKQTKLQEFNILSDKNLMYEKRRRVQEFNLVNEKTMPNIVINKAPDETPNKKSVINKKHSFYSKYQQESSKESTPIKKKCSCTAKSNPQNSPQIRSPTLSLRASPKPIKKKSLYYENKNWEQETASILKNNILSVPGNYCRRYYRSKSFVNPAELKNKTAFNLLPSIDIKNSPARNISNNLLTVGMACTNYKSFPKENVLALTKPVIDNSLKVN